MMINWFVFSYSFHFSNHLSARMLLSSWKTISGMLSFVSNIHFVSICGTLHSVDQYLNIKLTDISVTNTEKYPHMVCIQIWHNHWYCFSYQSRIVSFVDRLFDMYNCQQTRSIRNCYKMQRERKLCRINDDCIYLIEYLFVTCVD
jgi:small nuclear ribonucleoprotein (snRNP)-like protein